MPVCPQHFHTALPSTYIFFHEVVLGPDVPEEVSFSRAQLLRMPRNGPCRIELVPDTLRPRSSWQCDSHTGWRPAGRGRVISGRTVQNPSLSKLRRRLDCAPSWTSSLLHRNGKEAISAPSRSDRCVDRDRRTECISFFELLRCIISTQKALFETTPGRIGAVSWASSDARSTHGYSKASQAGSEARVPSEAM